jgi:type IV pilus assembly protein PilA
MRISKKGFSLVELMIVVAIIGILAAIAIPNFLTMQLKAKRGEVPGNVDGIKTSEVSYDAAFDGYLNAGVSPRSTLDKTAVAWTPADANWTSLGWSPDGEVRGNYAVTGAVATNFNVTGNSDVDGDGNQATYTADVDSNAEISATTINNY